MVTPRSAYVLSLIVNDPTSSQTRALFGSISAAVYEVFARETTYAEFPSDLYLLFAAAAPGTSRGASLRPRQRPA